jgi:hypothetical protein
MGPAGSGKSTYCYSMQQHFEAIGRRAHIMNLDPAAEDVLYTASAGNFTELKYEKELYPILLTCYLTYRCSRPNHRWGCYGRIGIRS